MVFKGDKKPMTKKLRTLALSLLTLLCSVPAHAADAPKLPDIDSGNTTWILVSSALVMIMTPGLAFFYAGMVSRRNVVSTLLQNFAALGVVGVLWIVVGYSYAFSPGNAFLGSGDWIMLKGLDTVLYGDANGPRVPHYAFMAFQAMFAVITPALITGAIAERVHFKAWLLFMALWSLVVYIPIAHWVWEPGGWLAKMGGLDFAGGLVVHMSAGFSALVAAVLFGKRNDHPELHKPNDIPMILLGAALLFFGWFGFNAGSAISAGFLASHAFVTTFLGGAAAMIGWMLVDWYLHKPTGTGSAIGLVVGLVVITPAAGYVTVGSALGMCFVSAIICNFTGRYIKEKTHLDDALDVFACHGVGGMLGAIGTGLLASHTVNPAVAVDGFLISGQLETLKANMLGVAAVGVFAPVMTVVLLKLVNFITPLRVSEADEAIGLDTALHGEVSRYYAREVEVVYQ
jgi:Amt family ammonium transporter